MKKPAVIAQSRSAKRAAKAGVEETRADFLRALSPGALALEEARQAGLLDGERTEHLSFRAPKALLDAARRQSGVTSPTELGLTALALLAQPDPTAAFLRRTRGRLGPDHALEY